MKQQVILNVVRMAFTPVSIRSIALDITHRVKVCITKWNRAERFQRILMTQKLSHQKSKLVPP